jgi:hypothetical protein
MTEHDGWETYSKLVLQQLETLGVAIESLRSELQGVRNELTQLKAKEDRVQELKEWKEKVDEVASPRQMLYALRDIEELKIFKTKSVTIFLVAQAVVGFILAYTHLL